MRTSTYIPYQQGPFQQRTAKGAADFLRAHDKMASILPVVTRMAALQKDCADALPSMFDSCSVLSYESDQLVLAIPNSALASKLKQKLPKLLDILHSRGWKVIAIRMKVQVTQEIAKKEILRKPGLPSQAILALASLDQALGESPNNRALKTAVEKMLRKNQAP